LAPNRPGAGGGCHNSCAAFLRAEGGAAHCQVDNLAGLMADLLGIEWAIGVVGGLTFLSGVVVAKTMAETTPTNRTGTKHILEIPTERSTDQ
jgi:hypothetical protein